MITAIDLETVLIARGLQAPPPVCISWCSTGGEPLVEPAHLVAKDVVQNALNAGGQIEGHNIAYDMLCLLAWYPELALTIFMAYDQLRIVDTGIRERIAEIEARTKCKRLNLETLATYHGMQSADKADGTRLSYGRLLNAPLSDYSDEQIIYAKTDAAVTLKVGERQRAKWPDLCEREVAILTRKAFWLALVKTWGMRTHPDRVGALEVAAKAEVARLCALAVNDGKLGTGEKTDVGFVSKKTEKVITREAAKADEEGKPHPNHYKQNMKVIRRAVQDAYHGQPPITETGEKIYTQHCVKKCCAAKPELVFNYECPNFYANFTATDRVTLEESGDPILQRFSEYGQWTAVANKDVPMLLNGVHFPIHTRYGLADTTRTTSSAPNMQNVGNVNGIRECFVPPKGYAIISADYSALEMCTLAQTLIDTLGDHTLADQMNTPGFDPHAYVGAEILGVSYDEMIAGLASGEAKYKQARSLAKVPNFGKPGGMADLTLIGYARGLKPKVTISEDQAIMLGNAWRAARQDVVRYLNTYVRSLRVGDKYDVPIPRTNIVRKQITYCAAANTGFQAPGAMVTDRAGWELAKEMYLAGGRLNDVRCNGFIHDEFLFEVPLGRVAEVAPIIEKIMITAGAPVVPDVQLRVEAVAMDRWSKKAEPVRNANGGLEVWTP